MSGGQINGPGASQINQQLPDTKALDKAQDTEVIRLKNGKFKVGTSKGSAFNRTVRRVFMPKTYQREAAKATQFQQSAAVDAVQSATSRTLPNVSLRDRQITVAEFRHLMNPPKVPDSIAIELSQPGVEPKDIFSALQDASDELHEGEQYKGSDLAGNARFGNIHVPHKTAVHVMVPKQGNPGELESKPFHANYVGGSYIATQAPIGSKGGSGLMLQMLYNEDTSTVVNLTNQKDKTGKYWPEKGQTQQHGNLLVQTTDIEKQDGFDVITLKLGQEGIFDNDMDSDTAKEVKIFHYHGWPDHGVPEKEGVKTFNHFMDEVKARGEPDRTTVHCRAGVGRTGVFIALDQLKQEAHDGTLDRSNLLTRTAEVVWSGRQDRGKQFVQANAQFEFIVSELEKELTTQEEPAYENLSYQQGNPGFEQPPAYTPPDSKYILGNWKNYGTQNEIIADINAMNSQTELEALATTFMDALGTPGMSKANREYYQELLSATQQRIDNL